MIESNIINMVNLDENMQKIDVYQIPKLVKFFNFFRILLRFKKFNVWVFFVAKCLVYLQVLTLNLTGVDDDKDSVVNILKYVSPIIYPNLLITDGTGFKIAILILLILVLAVSLGMVFLYVSTKKGDDYLRTPLSILNFVLTYFFFWIYGPCIFVCLQVMNCTNGVHDLMKVSCYSDITHILCCVVAAVFFIFFGVVTMVLSIYWNEIGTTGEPKVMARINCNYCTYLNSVRISLLVFSHLIKYYGGGNKMYTILLQIYLTIGSAGFLTYVYKIVFFYNPIINATFLYGWIVIFWFSLIMLLKSVADLHDTALFLITGWVILITLFLNLIEIKEEYILTDLNILEAKSLKDIEMFTYKICSLMEDTSPKNKLLLVGIIHRFEESLQYNDDLRDKYYKLLSNTSLKKKYMVGQAFNILRIIYVVYEHHLEKSLLKNDLLLILGYNLINKFRNVIYAVYVCSKIKAVTHKQLYLKYLMMEEVKADQIGKLQKSNNKESVKHIQIGSVILYNTYIDIFRMKIFDAVSSQIDYFEMLRSNITTPKTTDNFLAIGQNILDIKKQILDYWERIIGLNPFSEECFKDYLIYLDTIVQDEELAKQESKKFNSFRSSKLSEQSNVYHSMFSMNSGVLLVDGWCQFGKVLYATPNLPLLFNFSLKDGANMHIDDVSPNLIREIHKEIIEHGVKFTNIQSLFGSPREILLKGKTGSMFNIKVYIKCIPNLTYGLIYVINVTKSSDNNFVILLEKDFVVNGLTELFSQGTTFSTNPYGIDRSVVACHVAVVMPSILFELRYSESEGYYFPRNNIDIKCKLYTLSSNKYINEKIQVLMETIKQRGELRSKDSFEKDLKDYEELLKEIESKATNSHNVFYKLITRKLMMGKYRFHRINIINDLISHENPKLGKPTQGLSETTKGKIKSNSANMISKQIKVKIIGENVISNEDEKKLLDKEVENPKEIHEHKIENENSISSGSSSGAKSQTNSTSFNKLRENILQKKEISQIKIMKYLSLAFGIGSILLVFFSSQNSNNKFTQLNEYLSENLVFNYSKILVSCTYLNTLNLKFMRDQIYSSDHCYKPCEQMYSTLLSECISEIKTEKENSSIFFQDFVNILSREKEVDLQIYNMTNTDKFKVSVDNTLNLFVTWGLNLKNNVDDYLYNKISTLKTPVENTLTQTLSYLNDNLISGYIGTTKQTNIDTIFSSINTILLIEIGLFTILIVAFVYLICNILNFESFYLKALIKFKTPLFDAYLKKLDEVKKKLRNDSAEEDAANQENGQDEKKSEKSDGEEKKKKKKGNDKDEDGENNGNRRGKKKKKVGINYQEEKMIMMGKYFLYWNILFAVKVIAILLLSVSYYLVVSIIDGSNQTKLLNFDSISNDIQAVYKESTDIYVQLKTELSRYIEVEVQKRDAIIYLNKNTGASVDILGTQYSKASEIQSANVHYVMKLPNQVVTPKVGSILMNLYNTQTSSTEITELTNLYSSDACSILFDQKLSQNDYVYCSNFWSNILMKGMEQAITQMSVAVTTVLDDLNAINVGKKSFEDVIQNGSPFSQYELFVEYYLYNSYMKTVDIFKTLSTQNAALILNIYNIIMIGYICFISILFVMLIYFVYKSKDIFNNLMNFIGILPAKYLAEDQVFYREILKLEQYID